MQKLGEFSQQYMHHPCVPVLGTGKVLYTNASGHRVLP